MKLEIESEKSPVEGEQSLLDNINKLKVENERNINKLKIEEKQAKEQISTLQSKVDFLIDEEKKI